jgi:uncharacterized protein (DUF486 family)
MRSNTLEQVTGYSREYLLTLSNNLYLILNYYGHLKMFNITAFVQSLFTRLQSLDSVKC